jgi:hypothetical protein
MNALIVYEIVKALPKEERKELLHLIQKEFVIKNLKNQKQHLKRHEALHFLLDTVFNKI